LRRVEERRDHVFEHIGLPAHCALPHRHREPDEEERSPNPVEHGAQDASQGAPASSTKHGALGSGMLRAMTPRGPRLLETLRHYDAATFARDCMAGVTVGLVALPLAMAFGISSGASPESGIYTAIVAGFLISALGGSRVQVGGPTGAFVVVVSGIIAHHGLAGLYMCTFLAGILLVIMGLTGLGAAVRFLPRPVVVGFTNGIALLIASTQVKDLLGLHIASPSGVFLPRMIEIGHALGTISPAAAALGLGALALVLLMQRFVKAVPGAIVALVLGTLAVKLCHLGVETIGSRFGGIPSGLPPLHLPNFHPE